MVEANGFQLAAERLCHVFADGMEALSDVCLRVRAGEFILLCGRNGSGKTVLLRHFNGLLRPTSGEVTVEGRPVGANLLRARQAVGLVFQEADSQIVGQTVFEDVAFGPENLGCGGLELQRRVRGALEAVGLSEAAERRPYLLSGGEKRRLSIAAVIAMEPKAVLLDEPFINLDYEGVVQVLRIILALNGAGKTVIVATHELEKIAAHAGRIVVMDRGRIVADGKPGEVLPRVSSHGLRRPDGRGRRIEELTWLP